MVKLVVGERISPPLGAVTVTVAAAELTTELLRVFRFQAVAPKNNKATRAARTTDDTFIPTPPQVPATM
jgi:hypothetical protein